MKKSNKSYHKLILWEKFKELLVITYQLTDKLPESEKYGLRSQMKRAIVSVISNFVEGYLKSSKKEKIYYMETSETSLMELEAQGEICKILNYWSDADYEKFEVKRSMAGYFLNRYKSKIN